MSCGPIIVSKRVPVPLTLREPVTNLVIQAKQQKVVVRAGVPALRVREEHTTTVVKPVVKTIKITDRGPPGPPGPVSDGIPAIPFSYGDASSVVATAPADGIITIVRIDFETPFNGAGAQVTVGVLGDTDALMPATQNEPSEQASFEDVVDYPVTAGMAVWLDIVGGSGATQGAGVLFLGFVPEIP